MPSKPKKKPLSIFISYSHRDARWLKDLEQMLQPLTNAGELLLWSDTQIVAGTRWRKDIAQAIETADVAILLVSAPFLASKFIAEHELPPLLKASGSRGLPVMWISVSDAVYEATEIAEYQSLNDPARPLDTLTRAKALQTLKAIALKVRKAVARSEIVPAEETPSVPTLNVDPRILQAVQTSIARGAPEFAGIFDSAHQAATLAAGRAGLARLKAREARALLAHKLSDNGAGAESKRVLVDKRSNAKDTDVPGLVIWNSGDEYAGQIRHELENGVGVYKIYSATRDSDPNSVNTYEGEMSAGGFGPYGTYTFANSSVFAGEWVDNRPKLGLETFVHGKYRYELYLGAVGTDIRDGMQHWLPHGYGVGVSIKRKKVICDRFTFGRPSRERNAGLDLAIGNAGKRKSK